MDQDIGSVGVSGSAGYSSGTFTVKGGGAGLAGTADAFHFVYQSLSGDGFIVVRVVSVSNVVEAGVMIRETLNSNATNAFTGYQVTPRMASIYRTTTGGSAAQAVGSGNAPYWIEVVRDGSTFSSYISPDGVNWTQVGTSQTISMASSVYVGLAVTSGSTSTLGTATFDNVSITSGTSAIITGISPTYGGLGSSVTINGLAFGATQGTNSVKFNGVSATSISSWSNTQIIATVPSAATTGLVTVIENGVGSSGAFTFTVYNPTISSLSPPSGPIGGSITLHGSGFGATQGSSTVQFNGVNAGISTWTDTSIVATVPSGATTGPVTVTEGGVTSNSVSFTVIEANTVTTISPIYGPPGTSVVITGTGFGSTQSSSTVSFYGGTVTSITS